MNENKIKITEEELMKIFEKQVSPKVIITFGEEREFGEYVLYKEKYVMVVVDIKTRTKQVYSFYPSLSLLIKKITEEEVKKIKEEAEYEIRKVWSGIEIPFQNFLISIWHNGVSIDPSPTTSRW